jgi:hypothetical protein
MLDVQLLDSGQEDDRGVPARTLGEFRVRKNIRPAPSR